MPHLLVQPPPPEREWIPGSILRVAADEEDQRLRGGPRRGARRRHGRGSTGLPAPYLKRLTLEGSGDRARWTTARRRRHALRSAGRAAACRTRSAFAPGPYRYLRVTWNDANSGRVPTRASVAAQAASRRRRRRRRPRQRVDRAPSERAGPQPLSRPASGAPGCRSSRSISTSGQASGGHVYRRAIVTESRFAGLEAAPVELGSAMLVARRRATG